VRDALHATGPGTRDELAAPEDMEACVERLCDHVRFLREHDVSPATLYALSPGSGMTAELQALAIAYEAYDRYLLESPQHDLADLCGWATAQLRTGRATWLEAATVAVYNHIELSGAAASFLRALRDYAGRFEQMGAGAGEFMGSREQIGDGTTGPPASVSARVAAPNRLPDLDAMLSTSSEEPRESSPDTHAFFHDMLSRHLASDSSASLSWIAASGGLQQALRDLRQMGWKNTDIDLAIPTRPQTAAADRRAVSLQAVPFEAAGFRMRDLLVVDATTVGDSTPEYVPPSGSALLDAQMRQKIETLTGAVLPAHGSDPAADIWQIAQMLWRHGGEAVIVTAEPTGPVSDLLQKHLKPYVLQNVEK